MDETEQTQETNPEELFPPKVGGLVHTHRANQAAAAANAEAQPIVEPKARNSVKVEQQGTELARARTFVVVTGGATATERILGEDEFRLSATILTLDEPVVISFSRQSADNPSNQINAAGLPADGFVLPVNVMYTVPSTTTVFATATSSTPTRVSVSSFTYSVAE